MSRVSCRSGFRFPFSLCVLTALATGACNTWAVCHLTYYGGPLVSNVQVVPVMWGSFVNAQVTADIAQFYSDATVSPWYDILREYASVGGTNQSIRQGSAIAAITITPSKCASSASCNLTDAELQNELVAQITAGHLPAPQLDGAGYTNTAYMVHFPPNVSLRDPNNALSCTAGGFCAYHGTATFGAGNTHLPYSAVMDTFSGGCSLGCGTSATAFENETSVASHQLAEIATDADIGFVTSLAYPLGWYSSSTGCGEIGDICSQQQATTTVSGRTWTIQKQWSNAQAQCVSTGVAAAADGTTLSTACPTTFVENQSIALVATVSNGVNPTGGVTFADGPAVFCSNAALVSGAASCQTAALMVQGGGTSYVYNPIASYSGDGANNPSASSSLPLTILAAGDVVFRGTFETVVVGCPAF